MASKLIKIKSDIINGIVADDLYVDDFIISDGWTIRSFNYIPPKGDNTHVKMDVYLKNAEEKIVIEEVEFDFKISNVKKVLLVLNDPQAFYLSLDMLNSYPPENINKNDIIKKYPFTNILKINYVKPGEIISSTEAIIEFEISGIIYSSKIPMIFKETWSINKFNSLKSDDINIHVGIVNKSLRITDSSFKFKTDSLRIKSTEIIRITREHMFDVEIIVQGFVDTKKIRKLIQLEETSFQSLETIFEETVDFVTNLSEQVRLVTTEMIVKNVLDKWIDVNSIDWINHEDLETRSGQYLIRFVLGSSFVEKTFVIDFEKSQTEYWINKINADSIKFDAKYATQPEVSFPIESVIFINDIKMHDHILAQFFIESIVVSSEPGNNQRFAKYNVEVKIGNKTKMIVIEVEFQKTIFESTMSMLDNTKNFLEDMPSELYSFEALEKTIPLFTEGVDEVRIVNFADVSSKVKVIKFNENMNFKVTNIWIKRFDKINSTLKYKFEISVKGMRTKIYKTIPWNNMLTKSQNSLRILKAITAHDINIVDSNLLSGKPLPFYSTDLFTSGPNATISMIELVGHDSKDSRKINLKFTIVKDDKSRVIEKQVMFAHFLSDLNVRNIGDDDNQSSIEDADIEDQNIIDSISMENIQVFLDLSEEPLRFIPETAISGIPDEVEKTIEYDFPKPGKNSAMATIVITKNYAAKRIPIVLDFEKPMSKKTYKIYKKANKRGGK